MKTILALLIVLFITSSGALVIQCDYKVHPTYGYGCEAKFLDFQNKKLKSINGNHVYGKTHQDVRYFNATSDKITQLPEGLEKRFQNLETLYLDLPNLERLCNEDLKPFNEVLRNLMVAKSKLDYIPADLFASTPNITFLYMRSNELQSINQKAFKPLKKVKNFFANFSCMEEDARNKVQAKELIDKLEIACFDSSFIEPATCKPFEIDYDVDTDPSSGEGQEDVVEEELTTIQPFAGNVTQPEINENVKEKDDDKKMIYWIVGVVGVVMVIVASFVVVKIFKK